MWIPSMSVRLARITGDDKVYVAQAVEMQNRGVWFEQTLAGVPLFLKGPFHYILIRVGTLLFGNHMLATLYMNWILGCIGITLLFLTLKKWLGAEQVEWALWTACCSILSIDIWLHAYASMMDFELTMFTVVAMVLATLKRNSWFWIWVGMAGWIKSPANSVLMGLGGMVFWWSRGLSRSHLFSKSAWLSLLAGVGVCVLGYLPMAVSNWTLFYESFLMGENVRRSANGFPWWSIWESNLGFSLFPWTLFFWTSVGLAARFWRSGEKQVKMIWWLGFSFVVPVVAFFTWHPYRHNHYGLPAIPGVFLMTLAGWQMAFQSRAKWVERLWIGLTRVSALALLLVGVALVGCLLHFSPMPAWWSAWFGWLSAGLMVLGGGMLLFWLRPLAHVVCLSLWMSGLLMFLTQVGEREMIDLRRLKDQRPGFSAWYYDVHHHPWSEWAYLRYMVGAEIRGVHSEVGLSRVLDSATKEPTWILVPGDEWLKQLEKVLVSRRQRLHWSVTPWVRWVTRPNLVEAWHQRDLSRLERSFWIVSIWTM